MRILYVDDVLDWRFMLSAFLSDRGMHVVTASNVVEATRLLTTQTFDAVIVDVRLDEWDEADVQGLTLARWIRQRFPAQKIIVLTGYGTMEMVEVFLRPDETGLRVADDFVEKDEIDRLLKVFAEL